MDNVDSLWDWGHARDSVEKHWRTLMQDKLDDFMVATARTESMRHLMELAASNLGVCHAN